MPDSTRAFIQAIHATPYRVVLALSGGGTAGLANLLEVPGASRTVLEAVVPYSEGAMIDLLGARPDQFCSPPTARAMAMAAFQRGYHYSGDAAGIAGISCTASLATDRLKRGSHRVHLALQNVETTVTWSLEMEKGRRTRGEEERLVSRLVLNTVAEACRLEDRLSLDLIEPERVERAAAVAPQSWRDLLVGSIERVRHAGNRAPDTAKPAVLFPGSFNPLHAGHRGMAQVAEDILGVAVEFEMSILNVDKPPLDYQEVESRTRQFAPDQAVWLTRSPTFEEKSRLFPGATFVVGSDTLARVANPRYYNHDVDACRSALERIAARGCRFLVFGRSWNGRYVHLADLELPETLLAISREVAKERFREDISSTEIRRGGGP